MVTSLMFSRRHRRMCCENDFPWNQTCSSVEIETFFLHINDGGENLARRHGLATATRFANINPIR